MERNLVGRVIKALTAGRWITLLVSWVAIFLLSAAWAISSPLGASPDEPAHIIKAASVARGQLIGELTSAPAVTQVLVPEGLSQARSWPCYAFKSTVEANCIPQVSDATNLVGATTSAGLYNPTFYALVGLPSLLTNDTSLAVMIMRLSGALVASLFLAVTFCALLRLGDPFLTGLGFMAAVTPMVLFLNGAVNPNALEIAAGAVLLTALLVVVHGESGHHRWWLGVVTVSGLLMAQARGLSPLWMALIAAAVLIYAPRERLLALFKRADTWLTVGLLGVGVGAAGAWTVATGTLGSMGVFPGAGEVSRLEAFVEMLVGRSFDPGTVGVFGWLDTYAPGFDYALWSCLGVGIVVLGLSFARGRVLVSVIVSLAGFLLIPAVVQAASVKSSGYIWQGRYALVGYVVTVLIASIAVASSNRSGGTALGRTQRSRLIWILGGLVAVGHVFAIATTIKRYAAGADSSWLDMIREAPDWLPPGGWAIWLVLAFVGMSTMVGLWALTSGAFPVASRAGRIGTEASREA